MCAAKVGGSVGGSTLLFIHETWISKVSAYILGTPQEALVIKNLPASAGDIRDAGLIPGLGRSLGGGHGNPLQYSSLENPMDRAA